MTHFDSLHEKAVVDAEALRALLEGLRRTGYALLGPRCRDGAIVYDGIESLDDLPRGWRDRQEAGSYRLEKSNDESLFGYVVGPHSWKQFLFPSVERLCQVSRNGRELETKPRPSDRQKRALVGARPCELAALAVQDKVFMGGTIADPHYRSRRESLFILAVNCANPASTCFCASMETGPAVKDGYDLALTEIIGDGRHEFVVQVGSDRGGEILQSVPHRDATEEDQARQLAVLDRAEGRMGRSMETGDVKELLYRNYANTRWDEVAERCLSCGNCTLVCPTCFCSTMEDVTDLSGDHAERWRKWDSCFTMDFSFIVGGSVRPSTKARFRQWMIHKLATWQDQFGVIGCVGCGRCITWCPVGIDIRDEVSAIRASEIKATPTASAKEK